MTPVHVAVGVILNRHGQVLITRRAPQAHQGNLWEFPGGKVESGESLEDALTRELREELGIAVVRSSALLAVSHDYGDKRVLLDVHVVWDYRGEPLPLEGQPIAWVLPADLPRYEFPAANLPIVSAIIECTAR